MAAITVVFIAAIALTALFFAGASGKDTLVLRDGDTKEEYARFSVSEGDEFSVTFIHSVNQYPLTDVYGSGTTGSMWCGPSTIISEPESRQRSKRGRSWNMGKTEK